MTPLKTSASLQRLGRLVMGSVTYCFWCEFRWIWHYASLHELVGGWNLYMDMALGHNELLFGFVDLVIIYKVTS